MQKNKINLEQLSIVLKNSNEYAESHKKEIPQNESIKITIRFLTNEIRADALEVKVFQKKCGIQSNCAIIENDGQIVKELKKHGKKRIL